MAELFTNLATSTLASGIASGALALTVQSGDGAKYPSPGGSDLFRAVLFKKSTGEVEIITCTARSADVLTITRGEEGTTPLTLLAGDLVELRPTAAFFNALSDPSWGGITGTLSNQTDLQAALDAKAASAHNHSAANITTGTLAVLRGGTGVTTKTGTGNVVLSANPTFTGTPSLPTGTIGATQAAGDSTTKLATTAFVQGAIPSSGAWTPTLQDTSHSDAEGQTYGSQVGTYTKIGNRVIFSGSLTITSLGTLTNERCWISGLPFEPTNSNSANGVSFGYGSSLAIAANTSVTGRAVAINGIELFLWDATAGTTSMLTGEVSAGGTLSFSGSYITDS